jgi:hypothetical protein
MSVARAALLQAHIRPDTRVQFQHFILPCVSSFITWLITALSTTTPRFHPWAVHVRSFRPNVTNTGFSSCTSVFPCRYHIAFIYIHSSVICHTTGLQPLPKRFLHLMRSRASSFKWEYPLLSPRSSSNFLRLLPRLLVTPIRPFIFPSITSFRRQFLRKIWPIQLAFRYHIYISL